MQIDLILMQDSNRRYEYLQTFDGNMVVYGSEQEVCVSTLSLRQLLGPLLYADILVLVFWEGEWREDEEDMNWLFFSGKRGEKTRYLYQCPRISLMCMS